MRCSGLPIFGVLKAQIISNHPSVGEEFSPDHRSFGPTQPHKRKPNTSKVSLPLAIKLAATACSHSYGHARGRHNDALAVELKLRQACQSCKFLLGSCVLMCPTPRQAPLKQSHLQMVDGFGLTSCVDPSFSTGLAGHRLGASSDPSELRKLCSPRPHTMIRCATAA